MAVLPLLWARARDPFEASPCVSESYGSLVDDTGYSERTVARAIQELASQSFLLRVDQRPGVGSIYRMLRPQLSIDEAALLARRNPYEPRADIGAAELASALRRETRHLDTKKTKSKKGGGDGARRVDKHGQRRDTLQRLGKTRRQVALVLEYGDAIPNGVEPNLAYSGKGAHEVNEAIDYLQGEKEWADLIEVVLAAERIDVPKTRCLLSRYRSKVLAALADGDTSVADVATLVAPALSEVSLMLSPEIAEKMQRLRLEYPDATDEDLASVIEFA